MESPSTLLVVQNIEISKNFYVNVLGLDLVEEHNDCMKFKVGHHEVLMFQGSKQATLYEHGYSANSTLIFTVSDIDNKINQLKSKGVFFVHETPNQNRWGRYAAFKDPSGIVHELFESNEG